MSDCNRCRYLAQGTTYCGVGLQVQQSCPVTTLQVPANNCSQYKEGPTAQPVETSNHSQAFIRWLYAGWV